MKIQELARDMQGKKLPCPRSCQDCKPRQVFQASHEEISTGAEYVSADCPMPLGENCGTRFVATILDPNWKQA